MLQPKSATSVLRPSASAYVHNVPIYIVIKTLTLTQVGIVLYLYEACRGAAKHKNN
jgi:hypothetical protein